jgi:Protein of unknown function (DUF1091)
LLAIDKIEVDIDAQYIKVKSELEAVDGINTVNLNLEVLKEETDVEYQAVVYRHNIDHYEHFYKSDMETSCAHGTIKDPILQFIFKETEKYGNVTALCPLKVGFYALKNFKIDSGDLPHQLPAGNYRFDFTAFIKKSGQLHDIYTDKYYFTSS